MTGRQSKAGIDSFATKYLHSNKFLQGDGGYNRIDWMTEHLKGIVGTSISSNLKKAIPTEKNTVIFEELKLLIKNEET